MIRAAVVMLLCLNLSGCWFVFIPGSMIQAVADGVTGDKGDNCVGPNARAGDRVRTPGGGGATIVSVHGTSMRCKTQEMPIRALLAFD